MSRSTFHLSLFACLLVAVGCDSAVDDPAALDDRVAQQAFPASPANVTGVAADFLIFDDTDTDTQGIYEATLTALSGEPFPNNSATYFTIESDVRFTSSQPTSKPKVACTTSLTTNGAGGRTIVIEDNVRADFVAYIPTDLVDELAQRVVTVTRSCVSNTGVALEVTGDLDPNRTPNSANGVTFPAMIPGQLSTKQTVVFNDIHPSGNLNADARSGTYTNTGVPYTLIQSALTTGASNYTCQSTLERYVPSPPAGVRTAEIESSTGSASFTPFIPSNLDDLFGADPLNRITFRRECSGLGLGVLEVSGLLLP